MMSESRPRVLIVDDDVDFGTLTRRRLAKLDADVDFHEGPEGASERVQKGGYRVVLLDLNMPGISGLQILASIKDSGIDVHVLLFSSMDEAGLAEIAAAAGVGYLSKSADKGELLSRIEALIAG
jgi:CheY-like chemotaxis protein